MLKVKKLVKPIVQQRKKNKMKRKRGQALVEFIIILPVFLLLVLGVIDMGRVLYSKIILEDKISDVITLYESGKTVQDINNDFKDMNLRVEEVNNYVNYSLEKEIDILTPGLNLILKSPYNLKVSRSILNE